MSFISSKNQSFNILKNKLNNSKNTSTLHKKEQMKNIVSTFRKGVIPQKPINNKYKTSKNSPERFYIEQNSKLSNKMSNGNININNNVNNYNNNLNGGTLIIGNQKQTDKNMENMLKRKIIKIKEKKSMNIINSNNSSLLSNNNSLNHTNTTNSINSYLMQTNYMSKMKNKMTIDNRMKNKILINKSSNYQKRSNSTIEQGEKNNNYYYYANSRCSNSTNNNNIYKKYISNTSSKNHNSIKSPFNIVKNNTIKKAELNKGNSNLLIHMKNSSLFSSTLGSLYKPSNIHNNSNIINKMSNMSNNNGKNNSNSANKICSNKFRLEIKKIAKTSYPTKNNSRKHSQEKGNTQHSSNKNSSVNINQSINNMKLNNNNINNNNNEQDFNNSPIITINYKKEIYNDKNLIKKNIQKNYIKNNNISNSKDLSKTNSREPSKNNSKDNILMNNKLIKNFENKNMHHKIGVNLKKNDISNKNSILKDKDKKTSSVPKNNNNIIKDLNKNIYNNLPKKNNILNNINKPIQQQPQQQKKTEEEKKLEHEKRLKENHLKDRDLENTENKNDSLLDIINSNIDPNNSYYSLNTNNMYESYDSIQSNLKENGKFTMYYRDMEIISQYIKKYYIKNGKYPTTKMRFYKYGRLLGKGAFGKVNLSLNVLTGRLVAIKLINKTRITSERQRSRIQIETNIMKSLTNNPYIVKIFETYETQKHICIVMEYICAGDLLSYIRKRSKLTEPIAKYIFKQIILGLQYIHNHNIVHRDIKLDNILIDLDNKIKICDFGVSKKVINGDLMKEQCGTPAYIAPEILMNRGYEGYGVDIWSAGVVLYSMLSGTVPFKGNNIEELHTLILQGIYTQIKDVSYEANHLIKCILEVDPHKRISIENILTHPWLIDVDVNNSQLYNLFTNTERLLLAKSNVDYRDINNKDDMIENFDLRNIDTGEESENKNNNSKSIILAPFNTSMTEKSLSNNIYNKENKINNLYDINNKELVIKNNVIKFSAKVKELNRFYELNNNQEIDNGIVISPNDSAEHNNNNNNIEDISPYNNGSYYSKIHSKPFSPIGELEEESKKNKLGINNNYNDKKLINYNNNNDYKEEKIINEDALLELENLGYKKSWVKQCLINNEINYATTSYYLLVKYYYNDYINKY